MPLLITKSKADKQLVSVYILTSQILLALNRVTEVVNVMVEFFFFFG
jgi:hypothetical protein